MSDELITAAFHGDLNTVELLAADASDGEIRTAFMNAAKQGHTKVVDFLLAKGAPINARLRDGYTALTLACRGDHWEVAKLLIENAAALDIPTAKGFTALMFAASEGQLEIVEALLSRGADANAKNEVGATALLLAKGHNNVTEALLRAGAVGSFEDETSYSEGTLSERQANTSDKHKAIVLANGAIAALNSELEAVANFRRSVMGQGAAVDYGPITARDHFAKISALNAIQECRRLDPENVDFAQLHKQLSTMVNESKNVLRLNYSSLYKQFYPDDAAS